MNPQSSFFTVSMKGRKENRKSRQEMRRYLWLIRREEQDPQLEILARKRVINSEIIVCPRMQLRRKSFKRWAIRYNIFPDFSLICETCRKCSVGTARMNLAVRAV